MKPTIRPNCPNFSSGPCAKRPGWTVDVLADVPAGRSHRSKPGKAKLAEVIERSASILGLPNDWRLGIVPASDTGAVEMAMWSMLGCRGVDLMAWESFGSGWITDALKQLQLSDVRTFVGDYGHLPDFSVYDSARDLVFTWNGTTAGVKVPNADWISSDREGIVICDATSAAFAMDIDYDKVDVLTWSWQKVLGGEAAHGMLALSPRAAARLQSYQPDRALPKIFRMLKKGKLNEGIFEGSTINTPSMLATEDALDALKWAESIGGLRGLIARSEANLAAVNRWVASRDWVDFLAATEQTRSNTSICICFVAPAIAALSLDAQKAFAAAVAKTLDSEGVAYDIKHYRDAPPGLRIWGGGTVETSDIEALLPWVDWAYHQELTALA
ncbi:MAG TPA: phosphoserine transaminase [Myxococcales bacterium]|nr:phosphoserine transaminase [Myxococcales bacterium]